MVIVSPTIYMADDDDSNKVFILLGTKSYERGQYGRIITEIDVMSVHVVVFNLLSEKIVIQRDLKNPLYQEKNQRSNISFE